MARFVASDHHFFHKNILEHQKATRPYYAALPEMLEGLIERHNKKVKPKDQVLFLGDFSWGNIERTSYVLSRLNGRKELVLGNHDQVIAKHIALFQGNTSDNSKFERIDYYREINHRHNDETHHLVFCHFPMLQWNRGQHGSMMIHGHSHGHCKYPWENPRRIFDAGVDCHPNNEPFALEEIIDVLKTRPVIKHHN